MQRDIRVLLTTGSLALAALIAGSFLNVTASVLAPAELLEMGGGGGTYLFIDWLLPTMSGLQLIQMLRRRLGRDNIHITVVFPEQNDAGFARALEAGADDYIVGPLEPETLVERLKLYLAEATAPVVQPPTADRSSASPNELRVDGNGHCLRYGDISVQLQQRELRLMDTFAAHPGELFSREDLMDVMKSRSSGEGSRTVDVCISRLRTKLKTAGIPVNIRTVRTLGYIFEANRDVVVVRSGGRAEGARPEATNLAFA